MADELTRQGTWRCLNVVGDLLSWIEGSHLKLSAYDDYLASELSVAIETLFGDTHQKIGRRKNSGLQADSAVN